MSRWRAVDTRHVPHLVNGAAIVTANSGTDIVVGLMARRVFTNDPEDYDGMCGRHRDRSRVLHEALLAAIVLDWGGTDNPCEEGTEPPVTVNLRATLSGSEQFVRLIRSVASGVDSGHIEGLQVLFPAGWSSEQIHGVSFFNSQIGTVRLDNLQDDDLRKLFSRLKP